MVTPLTVFGTPGCSGGSEAQAISSVAIADATSNLAILWRAKFIIVVEPLSLRGPCWARTIRDPSTLSGSQVASACADDFVTPWIDLPNIHLFRGFPAVPTVRSAWSETKRVLSTVMPSSSVQTPDDVSCANPPPASRAARDRASV